AELNGGTPGDSAIIKLGAIKVVKTARKRGGRPYSSALRRFFVGGTRKNGQVQERPIVTNQTDARSGQRYVCRRNPRCRRPKPLPVFDGTRRRDRSSFSRLTTKTGARRTRTPSAPRVST